MSVMSGMLTENERATALAELEVSSQRFKAVVAAVPEDRWNLSTSPDIWAPAGVAEHIIVTDSVVARLLNSVLPASEPRELTDDHRRLDDLILSRVPDRSPGRPRIQAPEFVQPKGRFATREAALEAFWKGRGRLVEFVRTCEAPLRLQTAPHPVFGMIDGYQWILFTAAHTQRHCAQLEEAWQVSE